MTMTLDIGGSRMIAEEKSRSESAIENRVEYLEGVTVNLFHGHDKEGKSKKQIVAPIFKLPWSRRRMNV